MPNNLQPNRKPGLVVPLGVCLSVALLDVQMLREQSARHLVLCFANFVERSI